MANRWSPGVGVGELKPHTHTHTHTHHTPRAPVEVPKRSEEWEATPDTPLYPPLLFLPRPDRRASRASKAHQQRQHNHSPVCTGAHTQGRAPGASINAQPRLGRPPSISTPPPSLHFLTSVSTSAHRGARPGEEGVAPSPLPPRPAPGLDRTASPTRQPPPLPLLSFHFTATSGPPPASSPRPPRSAPSPPASAWGQQPVRLGCPPAGPVWTPLK